MELLRLMPSIGDDLDWYYDFYLMLVSVGLLKYSRCSFPRCDGVIACVHLEAFTKGHTPTISTTSVSIVHGVYAEV
jgi:hypothetical protein